MAAFKYSGNEIPLHSELDLHIKYNSHKIQPCDLRGWVGSEIKASPSVEKKMQQEMNQTCYYSTCVKHTEKCP